MSRAWILRQLESTRKDRPRTSKPPPFVAYRDNPVGFFEDVLGIAPWRAPEGIDDQHALVSAAATSPAITVRSGHKTGKSTSLAGIAWWWYQTRELARVIMTAPAGHQVRNILWRELSLRRERATARFSDIVPIQPHTGVHSDDGREIIGLTAESPEAFSGISGPNVLYLVDEASGVEDPIFEAIEGNRAGGAHVIYSSNPTRPSGTFKRSHYEDRQHYRCLHLNSENAAKYGPDGVGLARQSWVDENAEKHGVESAFYQVRVKGNFADEAENTIIGLALADAAKTRWHDTAFEGQLVLGVDPAREGDDETVIAPRRGNRIDTLVAMKSQDGVQVASRVADVVRSLRMPGEHDRVRVNVDVIGIGASVYDQLVYNHRDIIEAVGVNSSAKADDVPIEDEDTRTGEERYHNLRTQLHFGFRDWLRDGGAVPDDEALLAELVSPTFKFDARGRYVVEKKEEIKKRLKRSPDRADASMLSVYSGGTVGSTTIYRASSSRSSR